MVTAGEERGEEGSTRILMRGWEDSLIIHFWQAL